MGLFCFCFILTLFVWFCGINDMIPADLSAGNVPHLKKKKKKKMESRLVHSCPYVDLILILIYVLKCALVRITTVVYPEAWSYSRPAIKTFTCFLRNRCVYLILSNLIPVFF